MAKFRVGIFGTKKNKQENIYSNKDPENLSELLM